MDYSKDLQRVIDQLAVMRREPIRNYIAPGLTSWLVSGPNPDGSVIRMFDAERHTDEFPITPHDHDYDFTAYVLEGSVVNTLYHSEHTAAFCRGPGNQRYAHGFILGGEFGNYKVERPEGSVHFEYYLDPAPYEEGESYSMAHDDIHSITFSKGAKVLMIEGPRLRRPHTTFLEPWVGGVGRVPTFRTEQWMFQR